MVKQIAAVSIIVILLLVVIGQGIVINLSIGNVYRGLYEQQAATKYEVKDFRAVAISELEETRLAAEMTRSDITSYTAYVEKQLETITGDIEENKNNEIKRDRAFSQTVVSQLSGMTGSLSDFGEDIVRFDKVQSRMDDQMQQQRQQVATAEEEAYRTVYKVCLMATAGDGTPLQVQEDCRATARRFIDSDFYEQDAPGWRWPLVKAGGLAG